MGIPFTFLITSCTVANGLDEEKTKQNVFMLAAG